MTGNSLDVVIPAYNAEAVIVPTLEAVLAQTLPPDTRCGVIVVDDGSRDATALQVRERFGERITVVSLPANSGRGNAINAGVQASQADIIVMLDADCVPRDRGALARMLAHFRAGAVVVAGQATSGSNDFWGRYTRDANTRRARQGGVLHMTTPFCGVSRALFLRVGGFCADYRRYGFEDRDLLLRLAAAAGPGAVLHLAADVVAMHEDHLSAQAVMGKMREAGCHTAPLFRQRYPAVYRQTDYARIDAATASWASRMMLFCLRPCRPVLFRYLDHGLQSAWLPYTVKCWLLRLGSALAYNQGCRER